LKDERKQPHGWRSRCVGKIETASSVTDRPSRPCACSDRALIDSISLITDGVEVIGEAGDAGELLRVIKELRPDVVLMDMALPGMTELEVLEQSTRQFPEVPIIVLAADQSGEGASRALRAGAAGYLPKSVGSAELIDAIATVARGEIYLLRATSKQTVVAGVTERDLLSKLTSRQREVLGLIVGSHSTKEIARSLNISVKTVETYRAQLMERLNIHDVAGLVRFAIRTGLIDDA